SHSTPLHYPTQHYPNFMYYLFACMSRIEKIRAQIVEKYPRATVRILDETRDHIGHREMVQKSLPVETHLKITVISEDFREMTHLDAIRSVNRILSAEFNQGLHAITLECRPPDSVSDGKEEQQ
ncbi:MAG: BolA family protein, partial [Alphaproteobacteria bacterium]|nr:BolA family protein [Alphaproteobacteria bacterium]